MFKDVYELARLAWAVLFYLVCELLKLLLVVRNLDRLHSVQLFAFRGRRNIKQFALVIHFVDHLVVSLHQLYLTLLLQLLERLVLTLKHVAQLVIYRLTILGIRYVILRLYVDNILRDTALLGLSRIGHLGKRQRVGLSGTLIGVSAVQFVCDLLLHDLHQKLREFYQVLGVELVLRTDGLAVYYFVLVVPQKQRVFLEHQRSVVVLLIFLCFVLCVHTRKHHLLVWKYSVCIFRRFTTLYIFRSDKGVSFESGRAEHVVPVVCKVGLICLRESDSLRRLILNWR